MKKLLFIGLVILSFTGCITIPEGAVFIKMYPDNLSRNDIAILSLQQKLGFYIFKCDGMPIYKNTQYVLLKPGRHKIWFRIQGQNLLQEYWITNKKYMDAVGGHTYIIKTKGVGLFVVGDKWYPEIIDVSNDPQLSVKKIPDNAFVEVNAENSTTFENSKLEIPTMNEGLNKK
jgi:hypothetical protein